MDELPTLVWAKKFGIAPEKLVLEITEEEFISESGLFLEAIDCYKQAGCRLAVDDYGKRASNIDRVVALLPDIMKIDMDYVHKSENSYPYREYLKSVSMFAENIGVEVLYEGIETQQQLSICMSSLGKYYQGHLLAEPQPSITNMQIHGDAFVEASNRSFAILQKSADHILKLRGLLDQKIEACLRQNPFAPGVTDVNAYIISLCQCLPDEVRRIYMCDGNGYLLSHVIERPSKDIRINLYGNKQWSWRGTYHEAMLALKSGGRSYMSTSVRNLNMKERLHTYVYAVERDIFILIDILRMPF
jgi:hypothetical protein